MSKGASSGCGKAGSERGQATFPPSQGCSRILPPLRTGSREYAMRERSLHGNRQTHIGYRQRNLVTFRKMSSCYVHILFTSYCTADRGIGKHDANQLESYENIADPTINHQIWRKSSVADALRDMHKKECFSS
ncbi:hypothetical protein JTE90_026319 [Oedothorax gibbosus]|uniref:Uncharacterized protein n=1 Tax=Oedothorax gibbosus TaxID=931172 RepID=A0AAV6U5W4_9ARAC|nr:hypothetical protein JTE90_026319 [Oedothorax gibbosus]